MRYPRLLQGLTLASICAGGASSYEIVTMVEEMSDREAQEAGFTWSVLRSDSRCDLGPRVLASFPLEMWNRPPHTISVIEVPPRNSLEVGRSAVLEIET